MAWCSSCGRNQPTVRDDISGRVCCEFCGKVLFEDAFNEKPTSVKDPDCASRLSGSRINHPTNNHSDSLNQTLEKGYRHIANLMTKLGISDGSSKRKADAFYQMAIMLNFTKGHSPPLPHVAAACLYMSCRADDKPFLLIDFAIALGVNVFVLGTVYLKLSKLLSIEKLLNERKPVDPSLFMHRLTSALLKGRDWKVLNTALRVLAGMKRDWMQTGRKPTGVCGAALYISALSHGIACQKSDILKVVHLWEATLTKRLNEFEIVESGSLTIEELDEKAKEFEKENHSAVSGQEKGGTGELLCKHEGKEAYFAHGLCRSCYRDFTELSGGLYGGSESPALKYNEGAESISGETEVGGAGTKEKVCQNWGSKFMDSPHATDIDDDGGASDGFSGIDVEVDGYLSNEDDRRVKKIIWDEMNNEYLQEQAAKEAAAAFDRLNGASDDVGAAYELASEASAAAAEKSREKRRKRARQNANPADATRQMLANKGLSSKINYDALKKLCEDDAVQDGKRSRTKSNQDSNVIRKHDNEEEDEPNFEENNEDGQCGEDVEDTVANMSMDMERRKRVIMSMETTTRTDIFVKEQITIVR